MSIESPEELESVKTTALAIRQYVQTNSLPHEDMQLIFLLVQRFRAPALKDFINTITGFAEFAQQSGISRLQLVKAVQFLARSGLRIETV